MPHLPIFQTYDIRGRYPNELNENLAYIIGHAFVSFLRCKNVVVGRDARLSSPALFRALVHGIRDQGANVTDIGRCTTPMLYFASAHYNFNGAIMITASHLDKEFNGFKLCKKKAVGLSYHTGGKAIERLVLRNKFPPPRKKGTLRSKNLLPAYTHFILSNQPKTNLKVVIDAANMMGAIDGKILARICTVFPLNFTIDGHFPSHSVNPLIANLSVLQKTVRTKKADLGIAFDGDADRVLFLDEHGRKIPPDLITALLAAHLTQKGDNIIIDTRSSLIVHETVHQHAGKIILSPAGHSLIRAAMTKHHARLGGEKSGHYYFRNFANADCALLAALQTIQILHRAQKTISQILTPFRKYASTPEYNFPARTPTTTIKRIERAFSKEATTILHIDGITVYTLHGWFNLRTSHTEQVLRLNIEAPTRHQATLLYRRLIPLLRQI